MKEIIRDNNAIFKFTPKINDLNINLFNVIKATGYDNNKTFPFKPLLDDLFNEAKNIIIPQCAYTILTSVECYTNIGEIYIKNIRFKTDRIISSSLKNISQAALFVGTVGEIFDNWLEEKKEIEDPFTEYLSNLIGSEIAESIARWVYKKIIQEVDETGLLFTNRYSPGYCGWNVEEQKKIFSFFPNNICGITLTDSALMLPIKSISGLVGIGEKIKWNEYPCEVCSVPHCYKNRRNHFVEKL